MLIVKQSDSSKLRQLVAEYSDFKADGKILFCKMCNKSISVKKIFTTKQHLRSAKHIEICECNAATSGATFAQKLIGEIISSVRYSQFAKDFCGTFVAADVPLYKIRNKSIKDFLEKYTEHKVPSETTLRTTRNHSSYHSKPLFVHQMLKICINNVLKLLKKKVNNHYLWMLIDEGDM